MSKVFKFFLVDDDDDDRELFQLALKGMEIEVKCTTAQSGIEAIEMLVSGTVQPDYIFLDLNMPMMDGRECLAELKANPATSGIPVIIFSTSSEPSDIAQLLGLGAIAFITKPSKISELRQSLNDFLVKQNQKSNDFE